MPTWVNASANEGILILQSRIAIEPLHACWACLVFTFSHQLSYDWTCFNNFHPLSQTNFCPTYNCWTLCGEESNDRPKVVNATVEELEAARTELKARMPWKWRKCIRNAWAVTGVMPVMLVSGANSKAQQRKGRQGNASCGCQNVQSVQHTSLSWNLESKRFGCHALGGSAASRDAGSEQCYLPLDYWN